MAWRESFGWFGIRTRTKRPTRFAVGPTRALGLRPLRFESLEDRRLLAVGLYLKNSADTGSSDNDNVTQAVNTGDLVFTYPGVLSLSPSIRAAAVGAVTVWDNGFALPQLAAIPFVENDVSLLLRGGSLSAGEHALNVSVLYQDWSQAISIGVPPNVTVQAPGNMFLEASLNVIVDPTPPNPPSAPNLLDSSDSGADNQDNVTSVTQPAFQGTGERNAIIRLFANGELVGEGLVGSNGNWELATDTLADGVYSITARLEDLAGNISQPSAALQIEIDVDEGPNTPYLDIVDASDTGRSNSDNVTSDSTPTVTMTTEDPNAAIHINAANLIYRIFDRPPGGTEVLVFDSGPGFTAQNQLTTTLPALTPDGVHNLKLEVEDRAGNISHDFLLPVTIDTVAPPVSIIAMDPGSTDTGVEGQPGTFRDRITSDTATGFIGRAEADGIVRLYADAQRNQTIDLPAEFALSVAVPLDGNHAFPNGELRTSFIHDLNHPGFFPLDGLREIIVEAEDLAGNVNVLGDEWNDDDQILEVFVDTRGPQVTAVHITDDPGTATDESLFDLFDPKPSAGPTPLVNSLSIDVRDLPARVAGFLYEALARNAINGEPATEPGHFLVRGDHNGVIPIESVAFNPVAPAAGQLATGTIVLSFFEPLPDDRFTLTISDALADPAGNALDGENNAIEPQAPEFPTGDGQPGGDFIARFTVDSRAEIGAWSAGSVYLDINGNFVFYSANSDAVNRDLIHTLVLASDYVFAGNFVRGAGGTADGFDKLAAYGNVNGAFRWLIDFDNDGSPDLDLPAGASTIGIPIAGNFDGNLVNGDEVGVFTGSSWWFDTDHDFLVSDGTAITSGLAGYPVVGDFDGDGTEDLGTWDARNNRCQLSLSTRGGGFQNARLTDQFTLGAGTQFIGIRERPVAADFDGDGIDDLGLWVPDRSGAAPAEAAEWYLFVSNGRPITNRITADTVKFTPAPFGADVFAQFGDEFGVPVVGNFDPPVTPDGEGSDAGDEDSPNAGGTLAMAAQTSAASPLRNAANPLDVTGDSVVTPFDALVTVNYVNRNGPQTIPTTAAVSTNGGFYLDVSGDFQVTTLDIVLVVNFLNDRQSVGGEGEGEATYAGVYSAFLVPAQQAIHSGGASATPAPAARSTSCVTSGSTQIPQLEGKADGDAPGEGPEAVIDDIAADVTEQWLQRQIVDA